MAIENMGFDWDIENTCFKRQYRWAFQISNYIGKEINMLPPMKSSRPSFGFKDIMAEHVNETIYFPGKPDFKPINVTIFDLNRSDHPIIKWIKNIYDPEFGDYKYSNDYKVEEADLVLYDGCGNEIEKWIYENVWIQDANFGELDYDQNGIVTCDITIRYDRAYYKERRFSGDINSGNGNIA